MTLRITIGTFLEESNVEIRARFKLNDFEKNYEQIDNAGIRINDFQQAIKIISNEFLKVKTDFENYVNEMKYLPTQPIRQKLQSFIKSLNLIDERKETTSFQRAIELIQQSFSEVQEMLGDYPAFLEYQKQVDDYGDEDF